MRLSALVIVLCLTIPVLAQAVPPNTPPAVDMSQTLKTLQGKDMKDGSEQIEADQKIDPNCNKCPLEHLGHVCFLALLTWNQDPANFVDIKTPMERAQQEYAIQDLAKRLLVASQAGFGSPEALVTLTTRQQQLIASAVGRYFPATVNAVLPLIDPSDFSKPVEIK